MTTTLASRPDLITVRAGRREIGAYALGTGNTTFVPAVDVTAIALAAMASATVVSAALAVAVALRRGPAVGQLIVRTVHRRPCATSGTRAPPRRDP